MLARTIGSRKPHLLLLSHCFPQATGSADRARAWQMLRLASATHRVHVACLADGEIRLEQWRHVHELSERIVIETRRPLASLAGAAWSAIDATARERWAAQSVFADTIEQWSATTRFDAVLCTHRSLWTDARKVAATLRLCDLTNRIPYSPRARRAFERFERAIAENVDIVTITSDHAGEHLSGAAGRTIHVPKGIDLLHFRLDDASQSAFTLPRSDVLAIGGNGCTRDESFRGWFADRVMPVIRKAVPTATLAPGDTQEGMRRACVVVSPEREPSLARWPILTAMAMSKTVVAAAEAAQGWAVRHGEHLLLSRDGDDWANQCIESLRSAPLRNDLARRARDFVERHCVVERTGRDLLLTLEAGRRLNGGLARAA